MLVSASSLAIFALPAIAQDAPASDSRIADQTADAVTAEGCDVIVVTHSRIQQRPGYDTPNLLVSISSENLEQAENVQIVATLAQNPALLTSRTGNRTSGSNADFGAVGVQFLDLRGLGESRTLTLVNARRHVTSLAGTAEVDINTIPTDLIESVDVLTGGASAIYGANGVSGAVNFRVKRNFEGVMASCQIGISSRVDAVNPTARSPQAATLPMGAAISRCPMNSEKLTACPRRAGPMRAIRSKA